MTLHPPFEICQLCGFDDYVTKAALGPGLWRFTCINPKLHAEPWTKEVHPPVAVMNDWEGITADLGLYEDLLTCLVAGEPLVEYGIVEYRYSRAFPSVYAQLISRYSHTRLGPKSFTTSSLIAGVLGRLLKKGFVDGEFGPATGYWAFDGQISYWALPGENPTARMSYAEFATATGLDPNDFTPPVDL